VFVLVKAGLGVCQRLDIPPAPREEKEEKGKIDGG